LPFKAAILITKKIFSVPPVLRWVIFVAYLAAIIYASLTPPSGMPRLISIPYIDKVVHFTMYFGFCLIGLWVLDKRNYSQQGIRMEKFNWVYVITLTMAISWGIVMEIFQRVMAIGRHYSVLDLIANILGALAGTAIYYYLVGRRFIDQRSE
jgi:VanZ family protein